MKRFYTLGGLALALTVAISAQAITPQAFQNYKNGQMMERTGDKTQAEQSYRMAIALDPSDSLSYIRLANIVESYGRIDEAITLYRTAQEFSPNDKMIALSLGRLLEIKQQPQQALIEYLKVTDTPTWQYPFAYLSLGRLQAKLNDTQRAKQSYEYFLKFYPDHPEANRELQILTGNQPIAIQQPAQQLTTLVAVAGQQNKMAAPVKLYMQSNQNFGSNLLPLPLVPQQGVIPQQDMMPSAINLEQQGRYTEAIQAYKQAILQAPQERYPSYLTIADLAQRTGNQQELLQALSAYQQFEPNNPQVLRGLGEMAMQEQKYTDAVRLFSKALTLNENSQFQLDVRKQLAYSLQMNNEYTLAASHYEKILKDDNDPVIKKNLALAYQQSGQFAKALPLYRQIVINEPSGSTLRNDMGQMLIAMANQANAEGQFKQASDLISEAQRVAPTVEVPQWGQQKENQALQVAVTPAVQSNIPYGLPRETSNTISGTQGGTTYNSNVIASNTAQNPPATILYNASPSSVPSRIDLEDEQPIKVVQPTYSNNATQSVAPTNNSNKLGAAIVPVQDTWGTTKVNPAQLQGSTTTQSPVTKLNRALKETVTGMFGTTPETPFVAPKYNNRQDVEPSENPAYPTQSIASANIPSAAQSTVSVGSLKETLDKANNLISGKRYEDAEELLTALHSESKGNFDSYVLLGQVHEKLSHTAQAEVSYENALGFDPNNTQLLSMLADMQRQNGSLLKAENSYKRLAKVKNDPDTYYQLGVVQHLNKNSAGATDSFNQAIALNPKWKDAYYGLGIAEESSQNYDKAIIAFERYLKLSNPMDPTSQAIKKHVAMLYNYNILSTQKPTQKDPARFNVEEY